MAANWLCVEKSNTCCVKLIINKHSGLLFTAHLRFLNAKTMLQ